MSHSKTAGSTANSQLQIVVLSFIGTIVAIAVSFAIFSLTQTARAEGTAKTADFDKYASAYMAGLTANTNMQQNNGSGNTVANNGCSDPEAQATSDDHAAPSYHKVKAELTKSVTNSYNNYMTNTTTVTKSYEKNINSNNTSTSNVDVSDSAGAVVSTNTSTSGDNKNVVKVENEDSNNSTVIEDSFNKDSHDKVVVVKDSFNETTNKTVIEDSFNKVEVNLNNDKKEHHPAPNHL